MPRNRRSSRDKIDIDVFNLQVLDAPDGLDTALHAFEVACHRGNPEIAEMVEALDSPSYLLEYLVSGTWRLSGIGSSMLPGLIIFPPSVGGGGICEVLEVDNYRFSYIYGAKYEHREHAAPPEIFVFPAVCGVPIRRRCTP